MQAVCAGTGIATQHTAASYARIPLGFQPNHGQVSPPVQYVSRGQGYSLFLTPGEAWVTLDRQPVAHDLGVQTSATDTLRMKLEGANSNAAVAGLEKQPGVVNYFFGNDPKKWHAGIPTYGKVSYTSVYPGIDLVFYGNQSQLEYDFVVAPGANPAQIAWQIEGAQISVDAEGNLQLVAPNGPAGFKKPVLYQMDGKKKISVDGRYVVAGNQVRFALGSYDHSKPLVIDPVLTYLTYLGAPVSATVSRQRRHPDRRCGRLRSNRQRIVAGAGDRSRGECLCDRLYQRSRFSCQGSVSEAPTHPSRSIRASRLRLSPN